MRRRSAIYMVVDEDHSLAYLAENTRLVSLLAEMGSPAASDILRRARQALEPQPEEELEKIRSELWIAVEEFRRAMSN